MNRLVKFKKIIDEQELKNILKEKSYEDIIKFGVFCDDITFQPFLYFFVKTNCSPMIDDWEKYTAPLELTEENNVIFLT